MCVSNREIVSFRSCVRARRGEAKLRERDVSPVARGRRGKVRGPGRPAGHPTRVTSVPAVVARLSGGCPVCVS